MNKGEIQKYKKTEKNKRKKEMIKKEGEHSM